MTNTVTQTPGGDARFALYRRVLVTTPGGPAAGTIIGRTYGPAGAEYDVRMDDGAVAVGIADGDATPAPAYRPRVGEYVLADRPDSPRFRVLVVDPPDRKFPRAVVEQPSGATTSFPLGTFGPAPLI